MLSRILSVFGANILGQAITILIQIISVPMFLHFWGATEYGAWLILTALPTYIIVSGTGIGFVSGNTMQKYISLNQTGDAIIVFQSAWALTIALSMCIFIITLPIIFFSPISQWLNIQSLTQGNIRLTLLILVVYVVLTIQTELLLAVYRASGQFARGINVSNILRILEFIGVMISIYAGAYFVSASIIYLIVRLSGLIWMFSDLRKVSWFSLGLRHARMSVIKAELVPTFSFLGFPLGHAFLIQGMTTVVGIKLGPAAVVIFVTIRTLTNFIKQFSSSIYYSVWPEFSALLSTGNVRKAKNLHRSAFQITLFSSLLSSLFIYLFGFWILDTWTNGRVIPDENFLLLMLISVIPNTLWMTSSYVSISINKHTLIALTYCILALLCMIFAYLLIPYFGLFAIPIVTLFADILILYLVLNRSFRIVNDSGKDFLTGIFSNLYLKKMIKNFSK